MLGPSVLLGPKVVLKGCQDYKSGAREGGKLEGSEIELGAHLSYLSKFCPSSESWMILNEVVSVSPCSFCQQLYFSHLYSTI